MDAAAGIKAVDKVAMSGAVQNAPFMMSVLGSAAQNLSKTSVLVKDATAGLNTLSSSYSASGAAKAVNAAGGTIRSVGQNVGVLTDIYALGSNGIKTVQDLQKGAYWSASDHSVSAAGNAGSLLAGFYPTAATGVGATALPLVIAAPGAVTIAKGYGQFYADTKQPNTTDNTLKSMAIGYRLGADMAGGALGAVILGAVSGPAAPVGGAVGFAGGVAITEGLIVMATSYLGSGR